MTIRAISLMALGAMVLTWGLGCQGDVAGGPPKAGAASIEDMTWQLDEVGGKRAQPVPADGKAAHLVLGSGEKRVSGYGGVNQFNGTYELNGQLLRFGPTAMTRRAGPEPLMTQEFNLTQALTNTRSWRSAGVKRIELLDASGAVVAKFYTR